MNKDTLISKQQLLLEIQQENDAANKAIKKRLKLKFYAIGQPLNDNVLKMNRDQLQWCASVYDLIEQIK